MTREQLYKLAACTPMTVWEEYADRWLKRAPEFDALPPPEERESIHAAIANIEFDIQRLARFAAYLRARHGEGCGDQGHKSAVKAQNRAAKQVRKALGYAHPDDPVNF